MVYSETLKTGPDSPNQQGKKAHIAGMDESQQLRGLHNLDPQIISEIHNRYFPDIYRYARYRLGDDTAAEDVAAETFTRLLEALHQGQGPRSSLRGWLYGAASHLVTDHLRRRYAHPTLNLSEDQPAPQASLASLTEQTERSNDLRQALASLTPEQQQVIALRFGNGYSLEETADLMRKNANAIKALQFRALASLRRIFGEG